MKHSFTDIKYNGSGGDGNYAVISISYDVGESVIVEHNGETYEAPDTSGIWLFGCEEAGTYVCSLVGSTIIPSETVTISEKGQMENISLFVQQINYALMYYLGDEITEKTGGFTYVPVSTDTSAASSKEGSFISNNILNENLNNMFLFGTIKMERMGGMTGYGTSKVAVYNGSSLLSEISNTSSSASASSETLSISSIFQTTNLNNKLSIKVTHSCSSTNTRASISRKKSNCLEFVSTTQQASSVTRLNISTNIYAFGLVKNDDIEVLGKYGNTIAKILNNSDSLFNDIVSLQKMVKICTGDFMINALQNSKFIQAMNASKNKAILLANEHWAKFIALLSV